MPKGQKRVIGFALCGRIVAAALVVGSLAFWPLAARSSGPSVRVDHNVAYATLSPSQTLDLYRPAVNPELAPLVVYIHGGGFRYGDKAGAANVINPLVRAGYAVASLDYRLTGEAKYPAQIVDVKAAVRYLRANARQFGLDPRHFAAFGGSAGGYLATMLGVSAGKRDFAAPALGNTNVSSAVQAVVDWFGPIDLLTIDRQRRAQSLCAHISASARSIAGQNLFGVQPALVPAKAIAANPISYIRADTQIPPMLIEHGTADCRVPAQQSRDLANALVATGHGSTTRLLLVQGAGHGPRFGTSAQMPTVVQFLTRTIPT